MKTKTGIFLIAIAAALLLTGCTSYGPAPTATPAATSNATATPTSIQGLHFAIDIEGFAFEPQTLTINRGTNITWTNKDSAPHTIKSEGNFESPVLQKGENWSHIFNSNGTFDYICGLHPSMTGKITVQ